MNLLFGFPHSPLAIKQKIPILNYLLYLDKKELL